ncbi:MAG: hypothetical protein WAV10_01500 [Minisyncoccia bacterium]
MSKKIIFVLAGVLFLFGFKYASASVVINEVMYDLDGADIDWIEVYNGDNNDIDLTTLKLLISNSTSNHGIVKYSGSEVLHQGEYGIIAPTSQISVFVSKWENSGNLFTSSFSLSNTSGKVEINNGDKLSPISSVTYDSSQGAAGDGNSLQLINGEWVPAIPTPGASNVISSGNGNNTNNTEEDSTNTEEDSTDDFSEAEGTTIVKNPNMKAKILTKTLAFIGQPLEFNSSIIGYSNENVVLGKIFWNFGDGGSYQQINNFEKFNHIYLYAGEYSVSMEYYSNQFSDTPLTISKMIIKVVPLIVSISQVGDEKDFFVELTNNSNYEIDISKWALSANRKIFVFPKNSVIIPKKQMIISGKITGFTLSDKNNLKLLSSAGDTVFNYGQSMLSDDFVSSESSATYVKSSNLIKNEISEEGMPVENLLATAIESDVGREKNSNNYLLFIGLGGLLIVSGGIVYFLRRNKSSVKIKNGDDFDILDE